MIDDRQTPNTLNLRNLTRRRVVQATVAGSGLALVGVGAWAFSQSSEDNLAEADAQLLAWPAEDRWPELFSKAPASVQDTYRYAVANKDFLQWMPCFCGCVDQGHSSNFDCYVKQVRGDGSVVLDTMSFG